MRRLQHIKERVLATHCLSARLPMHRLLLEDFHCFFIACRQRNSASLQLASSGLFFIRSFQGYETTAITTCFSLLLLGIHQDCQKKLFEEIQNILPDPQKPIEYRDIEKMGYLDRFLKEVLRKWGPAVVLSRSLKDDIKLGMLTKVRFDLKYRLFKIKFVLDDTYTIPKGANFVFWIRSLHYNPKIWPEPDKFDPDRFLPENIAKRPPNTYIPFSTGSRNCIGL